MATSNSGMAYQEYQEYLDYPEVARRRMEVLQGGKIAPKSRLRRDKINLMIAAACLFIFAFGYLYLAAQIGLSSKEISNLKADIEQINNDTARAELAYGELNSLARIEQYAIDNLGMVYPDGNSIYYLNQQNSALIAMGQTDSAVPIAEIEQTTPEDNTLWQSLAMMLDSHFFNRNKDSQ